MLASKVRINLYDFKKGVSADAPPVAASQVSATYGYSISQKTQIERIHFHKTENIYAYNFSDTILPKSIVKLPFL